MAKPTPPQEPKDQSQEPKRLGGFELLGRLGKGGMGTVLKARQVSMDRLVALKILPKKFAENEAFVQRFLREARSAARLRHPNIVQAFDVGFVDGYYFFAMEFVDGETLADMVRRDGPLEPDRALHVMKEVASALAAAHEEGIVHRDIKPANIMLDKKGEVRVTDFGLAKHTEGDVEVTADGAVVGTPAYVAPEMAKGVEADHRSDLYSLAATIFCILAGRPPFEGKGFSEILIKQANEPAPPLATLAPRVDRRLCHIIDRLLRKNPEARYPTANALLHDLNGLGKLQSVGAAARAEGRAMIAEAPTLEMTEGKRREREARAEAQRPPRSRTTRVAVAAIAAIIVVAGLIIALRSGGKPPDTATSVPDNRKPTTASPPEVTAKTPVVAKKTTPPEVKRPTPPEPKTLPPPKSKTPEVGVPVLGTVSFTAPSESKGLAAVSEGDGQFTTAEHEGKSALCTGRGYLYFRAADDFARLFQADCARTALVTITLLDTAPGVAHINYDSHIEHPGEPDEWPIWRQTPQQHLRGTGQWTQMKFELPAARFGHRQNYGADFRLQRSVPVPVHQVTVAAIEEDRPPNVPPQLEKGLAVAFYAGQNHERFVVAQRASWVNLSWDRRAPAPNVPADGFSTRLVGWLYIPEAGEYTFWLWRDDGARLYLDGRKVIDDWAANRGAGDPASVRLGAGWHRIWAEHKDMMGEADIAIWWRRGDRDSIVPQTLFYCEREMLERIRREPNKDPFAGLAPQPPVKAPDQPAEAPAEPKEGVAQAAAAATLAAYQAESDKLWALFRKRDFPAADALLAKIVGGVSTPRDPRRGDTPPTVVDMVKADQEAARLLREFWAAVEKGVAARKGTISIEGALGNVTGVENGVITIKTAKEPVTRRVVDLTAKQALAYAAVVLKDDERSHLAEAVFRIAEGEDPALAEKAINAAGNPPGVSCYKGRLAALTLGAAEVAARKAWAEIEEAAKPKPTKAEAQRLLALLDAFEKAHANTKHLASVRDKLPALRAQALPAPKQPKVGLQAVDISKIFNNNAFTSEDDRRASDFDRWKQSFPAENMPKAGLFEPKDVKTAFEFPSTAKGKKNNVACAGQTIPLDGKAGELHLLVTATDTDPQEKLTVIYTDGAVEADLKVTDWCKDAQFGEKIGVESAQRIAVDAGGKGEYSKEEKKCRIWVVTIPLDASRVLKSIKLPYCSHIHIFAITVARKGEERGETLEQALDRIAKAAAGVSDFSLKYTTSLPGNETGFDEDAVITGELHGLREGKTWLFRHTTTMVPADPAKRKAKGDGHPPTTTLLEVSDGQFLWTETQVEGGRKAAKERAPEDGLPDAMPCLLTLYPGSAAEMRKAKNLKLVGKGTFAGRAATIIEQSDEPQPGKGGGPKEQDVPARSVIHFDDASGIVLSMTLTDARGKERPLETLSELKVNSGLKKDFFTYTPPPGTQVEDRSRPSKPPATPGKEPGRQFGTEAPEPPTATADDDLVRLKNVKGLQTLDLLGKQVTDAGLVHLKGLKGLRVLSLQQTRVTDAGLAHLKELEGLRELELSFTRVTDAGLAHLKELKGLQSLSVRVCRKVTDAGLVHLKELKGLQSLNLLGTGVTDAGLVHLEELKGLQSLWLWGTAVTDAGLTHLKELKGLRELRLEQTQVTDAGLAHLRELRGLQWLGLSGTKVTDAGLAHLKELRGLQRLDLKGTLVADAGMADLKELKGLRSLDLEKTRVTDAGLTHLRELQGLQELKLSLTTVTDAGLAHLAELKELRQLYLNETQVTDAGLACLKELRGLQRLGLSETKVTDAGLGHLRNLRGLQILTLGRTQVSDAGLAHLKELKGLLSLDLRNTQVMDAGLARLKELNGLCELWLSGTQVTDAGLDCLKQLRKLQILDLRGTQVTDAGIAELKKSLPNATVSRW